MSKKVLFLAVCLAIIQFCIHPVNAQRPLLMPINALHPEKNILPQDIVELGYYNTFELLRRVVADFEISKEKYIAIYLNGTYHTRIPGNGVFASNKMKVFFSEIPIDSVRKLEAKYNPNLVIRNYTEFFGGSIHLEIPQEMLPKPKHSDANPDNPEPWLDPMTQRLLALREEEEVKKGPKVLATAAPRAGVFAGVLVKREAYYVGVPIEVPFNVMWSLQSDWSWGGFQRNLDYRSPTGGIPTPANFNFQAIESSLMVKRYFNPQYFRIFAVGGGYVERARAQWEFGPNDPRSNPEVKVDFGLKTGLGMQFHKGFFWTLAWSWSLMSDDKLIEQQTLRGVDLKVGFRIGRP